MEERTKAREQMGEFSNLANRFVRQEKETAGDRRQHTSNCVAYVSELLKGHTRHCCQRVRKHECRTGQREIEAGSTYEIQIQRIRMRLASFEPRLEAAYMACKRWLWVTTLPTDSEESPRLPLHLQQPDGSLEPIVECRLVNIRPWTKGSQLGRKGRCS